MVGSDKSMGQDGVMEIMKLLRDPSAPDAVASVYQEIARFAQVKRAAQTMDKYSVRFDLLPRKSESKMRMGRPFPSVFAAVICMQKASLSGPEE